MTSKVWSMGLLVLGACAFSLTPRESMPELVKNAMLVAPNTH
jgi:hypothetical protein